MISFPSILNNQNNLNAKKVIPNRGGIDFGADCIDFGMVQKYQFYKLINVGSNYR